MTIIQTWLANIPFTSTPQEVQFFGQQFNTFINKLKETVPELSDLKTMDGVSTNLAEESLTKEQLHLAQKYASYKNDICGPNPKPLSEINFTGLGLIVCSLLLKGDDVGVEMFAHLILDNIDESSFAGDSLNKYRKKVASMYNIIAGVHKRKRDFTQAIKYAKLSEAFGGDSVKKFIDGIHSDRNLTKEEFVTKTQVIRDYCIEEYNKGCYDSIKHLIGTYAYDKNTTPDECKKYYLTAIEHSKKNSIVMFMLSMKFYNAGMIDLAEKYILKAIENNDEHAAFLYACRLEHDGKHESAKKYSDLVENFNIKKDDRFNIMYNKMSLLV